MFWKKDDTEKRLKQMNELLKKSFANVKRDTTNIFQWLNYLYRKNLEQEQTIRKLHMELSYMPKTREDIRRIIDDYYSFEGIMAKIRQLDIKIEELARRKEFEKPVHQTSEAHVDLSQIEKRIEKLEQKKMSVKEKIIKRLTRNSKGYIKSIILSYIKKYEKISALQLKEMVVDEQNFCSKSSFYRLLEEIEQLEDIGVIKEGKEKHYLSKSRTYTEK
ncbi:hypothetical protein HYX02_04585 [Candidatus Woesearchaeota archaeon]|nr:hypothetical protein [Candidatus Woesearchaeota archaeon]